MEQIREPIHKKRLKAELTSDKFVRKTNFGNNDIYIFSHHDSPNLLQEVGRLRELAFRDAGGGTGKSCDIDEYDVAEQPYKQLIVWDHDMETIIGGYRFIKVSDSSTDAEGNPQLATRRLFRYSSVFKKESLPYTIELGRSFVVPWTHVSRSRGRKPFALDNLWDGLGALIVHHPDVKYFFGKVTMYPHFHREAHDLILSFLIEGFFWRYRRFSPVEKSSALKKRR